MESVNREENRILIDENDGHFPTTKSLKGNIRYDLKTGFPTAFYNLNYQSHGDTPEIVANNFIINNRDMLGLDNDFKLSDLQLYKIQSTPAGEIVRYHQAHKNVKVHESDLVITIDKHKKVTFVTSTYKKGVKLRKNSIVPKLNSKEVIARTHNKVQFDVTYRHSELTVLYEKKGFSRLVWKVSALRRDYRDEMEILIDAESGSFLQIKSSDLKKNNIRKQVNPSSEKNRDNNLSPHTSSLNNPSQSLRSTIVNSKRQRIAQEDTDDAPTIKDLLKEWRRIAFDVFVRSVVRYMYYVFPILDQSQFPSAMPSYSSRPSLEPSIEPTASPTITPNPSSNAPTVNPDKTIARGYVFDPDPIVSSNAQYGDDGFNDNEDNDSPELNAQLKTVTLPDVKFENGFYHLKGPFAEIVDTEFPKKGLFKQASPDFFFTRSQDGFEAVNCYYHVDKIMRYINVELEIPCRPYRYEGGIRVDPHGYSGDDNSHYVMTTQELAYGEGNVDDGEDASVIIHELGHGIHDWLTEGGLSIVEGLTEGFSDYIAASYGREAALKYLPPDDPKIHWIMRWDGHNEFWSGRTTNYEAKYTSELTGNYHIDGQIWATCNMKVWDLLGREKTDKANLIGISMTNFFSNQLDAAHAVLQAATNLGYSNEDIETIRNTYIECGYDVTDDVCGDGVKGIFEDCDGDDFGNATCASGSCRRGKPTCRSDCTLDYSSCRPLPDELFYEVVIITDDFSVETSWDIKNSSYVEVVSGGPYINAPKMTSFHTHGCLKKDQCYIFTIYDEFSDGLCCSYGEGDYDVIIDGKAIDDTDPSFTSSSVSHSIGKCS